MHDVLNFLKAHATTREVTGKQRKVWRRLWKSSTTYFQFPNRPKAKFKRSAVVCARTLVTKGKLNEAQFFTVFDIVHGFRGE